MSCYSKTDVLTYLYRLSDEERAWVLNEIPKHHFTAEESRTLSRSRMEQILRDASDLEVT